MHRLAVFLLVLVAAPARSRAEDTPSSDEVRPSGVRGRVVDAATKEPLIEATVKVVGGSSTSALTDVDGNYELRLPPGSYELRVFYEVYEARRVTGLQVRPGEFTALDVALSSDAKAVQEVVVEAKADKRAEGAVLMERKKATAVSDAISAQEIARTPDSNASDAVKRVVSATVVDGRFVLLRGLGGRYAVTLLNGALLPSPEPDEPAVPLDLFPTTLLANLNVVKSYTADLPGTFAGGALLIESNAYPTAFELKARLTLSGDTQTTFRQRLTHPGGPAEAFTIPGSVRALPTAVPTDGPLTRREGVDAARLEAVGESFPNVWSARPTTAWPNGTLSVSAGDTLRFGGDRRLGYLALASYGRKEARQVASIADVVAGGDSLSKENVAEATLGAESAALSGLANVGFQVDARNEFAFLSLYTRSTETRTQGVAGHSDGDNEDYTGTRLQFVGRALSFNQLRGVHRFRLLDGAELDWQANYSRVDRGEPDTRDVTYMVNDEGRARFRSQPGSGDRFYADLAEDSYGGSIAAGASFGPARVKVGALVQQSARVFDARRFRFSYSGGAPSAVYLPPEQLFSPAYIGANVAVEETTLPEDAYRAALGIAAGYLTAELKPVEPLRVVGGVRYEVSAQSLTADSPFAIAAARPDPSSQLYRDVLPTGSLVYAVTPKLNLRLGYSYTLARPTFRELAPFIFYDFVRRRAVSGNPSLVETRIHNGDLRAEYFLSESEVLAVSAFGKRFLDPIERVIVGVAAGDLSYRNVAAATVVGAELEARASLGRLAPALSPLRAAANLTLISSRIDLGAKATGAQTNAVRPLQGQSPYVLNLNLGYDSGRGTELAVLYNVSGPRISEVGFETLPDVYEQPFHRVDLALSQKLGGGFQLKVTASNLLNSFVTLRQGPHDVLRYRPGVAMSASLGWSL